MTRKSQRSSPLGFCHSSKAIFSGWNFFLKFYSIKYFLFGILVMAWVVTNPITPAGAASLEDGTYQGKHSFITVEVTIDNGKIGDVKIVEHGGGGEKYARMVEPLLGEMIEKQSTAVDVVTGATVSSKNLIAAVEDALQKAIKE